MLMPEDEYWQELAAKMQPEFTVHFSELPGILDSEEQMDDYTAPSEGFRITDELPAAQWWGVAVGDWPCQPWEPTDFDQWVLRSMRIDPL